MSACAHSSAKNAWTDFPSYVPGTEEERKLVRKIDLRIVVSICLASSLGLLPDNHVALYLGPLHDVLP